MKKQQHTGTYSYLLETNIQFLESELSNLQKVISERDEICLSIKSDCTNLLCKLTRLNKQVETIRLLKDYVEAELTSGKDCYAECKQVNKSRLNDFMMTSKPEDFPRTGDMREGIDLKCKELPQDKECPGGMEDKLRMKPQEMVQICTEKYNQLNTQLIQQKICIDNM